MGHVADNVSRTWEEVVRVERGGQENKRQPYKGAVGRAQAKSVSGEQLSQALGGEDGVGPGFELGLGGGFQPGAIGSRQRAKAALRQSGQ